MLRNSIFLGLRLSYLVYLHQKIMKYAFILSIFFLFSCSSENQKVEGKVLDENGEALAKVMVQVMGTDLYAYTDEVGYFAINTKSRGDELIFTMDGYQLGRYPVDEDQLMQVTLMPLPAQVEVEEVPKVE